MDVDDAATPLGPQEREGLIPAYITSRAELNEAEQAGVLAADFWAFSRKRLVLSEKFLLELHRRMFRATWKWAGTFRKTERNIGIEPYRITVELAVLLADAQYWIDFSVLPPDEIAIRFHHRLMSIHPFPNGNGRHARLASDLLLISLNRPRFSWGSASLVNTNQTRRDYIDALRKADRLNMSPLLAFARS